MNTTPKILVTDATGKVGFQLIKDLVKEGQRIRVLKNKDDQLNHLDEYKNSIEIVESNLLDVVFLEDAIEGIEYIYHCKELLSFQPQDKELLFKINIEGTRNIVNISLSLQVKKIVFISSTLAFGSYDFKKKVTEKTKWVEHMDNTFYSISKHNAELEINRGEEEGLKSIIICPSLIIGNSLNNSLYDIGSIVKNQYFQSKGSNGFVMAEDVSKACILSMESELFNEKFIISSENSSYENFFQKSPKSITNIKKIYPLLLKLYKITNWFRSVIFNSRPLLSNEILILKDNKIEFINDKSIQLLGIEYNSIFSTPIK